MNLKSFFIAAGILLVGVVGLVSLVALSPEPPKVDKPVVAPVVTVVPVEVRQGSLNVRGNGTVRPTQEVNLAAEVGGRVLEVAPSLVSGGFFAEGATLVRIDPTDYQNAVAVAEAAVTQRRYEMLLAEEETEIAREEWERLQARTGDTSEPTRTTELGSLVLKEPQLKLAEASLKSAEASLADATTRLSRTQVQAPFNGRVRVKNVDIGQYVGPGQAVATIYNTDEVEIVVPLTSDDAALIPTLWQNEVRQGASNKIAATVQAAFGGETYTWQGYVDRTEGTLDTNTRTVNVVIRVRNPYQTSADGQPPLMVGMFTTVSIEGQVLEQYTVIPRAALRDDDVVWIADGDRLVMRTVDVVQEVDDEVFIQDGLSGDERLVTTNLTVVTDGMAIRTAQ